MYLASSSSTESSSMESNRAELISLKDSSLEKIRASDSNNLSEIKTDSIVSKTDLGPLTPLPERETIEISSSSDQTEEEDKLSGCCTPTRSIFNPFAPGLDELACAPKKKLNWKSGAPLHRQLNFDSCTIIDDAMEEEHLFESVCRLFLEVIVSTQLKEISGDGLEVGLISEGFRTPTSLPLLTGVADTCPPLPLRPVLKSRNISLDICRKLDF